MSAAPAASLLYLKKKKYKYQMLPITLLGHIFFTRPSQAIFLHYPSQNLAQIPHPSTWIWMGNILPVGAWRIYLFFMLNLAICLLFFKTAFNSRMIHRPQWLAVRAQLTRSPSLSDLCGSLAERKEYFLPNKIYCVGKHTQGLFCRQLEGLLLIVVEK